MLIRSGKPSNSKIWAAILIAVFSGPALSADAQGTSAPSFSPEVLRLPPTTPPSPGGVLQTDVLEMTRPGSDGAPSDDSSPAGTAIDGTAPPGTVFQGASDPLVPASIAQAVSKPDDTQPIDLTPIRIPERGTAFGAFDSYKARILYRLPARMFFSATTENSLRVETNVFQTSSGQSADMVYRVLPNVTMGYALNRRTRLSTNMFFFRDQYTRKNLPLSRNIYSAGIRADHDIPINERTTLTGGLFARELFFNLHDATVPPWLDIIPSLVLVRRVGQRHILYGSVLGQVRFTKMFDRFQEFDQFYSMGWIYRKFPYVVSLDNTLVTNFGNSNLRGGPDNQVIILTGEIARQVSRNIPLIAFVRVEPIFNMGGKSVPGFSGVNFRCYGGLRTEVAKPAIFPIKLRE